MELPYLGTALWLNRDFAPAAVTAIQIEKQDHLLGKMRAAEKCRLVLGAELSGNSKKKNCQTVSLWEPQKQARNSWHDILQG